MKRWQCIAWWAGGCLVGWLTFGWLPWPMQRVGLMVTHPRGAILAVADVGHDTMHFAATPIRTNGRLLAIFQSGEAQGFTQINSTAVATAAVFTGRTIRMRQDIMEEAAMKWWGWLAFPLLLLVRFGEKEITPQTLVRLLIIWAVWWSAWQR